MDSWTLARTRVNWTECRSLGTYSGCACRGVYWGNPSAGYWFYTKPVTHNQAMSDNISSNIQTATASVLKVSKSLYSFILPRLRMKIDILHGAKRYSGCIGTRGQRNLIILFAPCVAAVYFVEYCSLRGFYCFKRVLSSFLTYLIFYFWYEFNSH